jgi:hypothetical protein
MIIHVFAIDFFNDELMDHVATELGKQYFKDIFLKCNDPHYQFRHRSCKNVYIYIFAEHHWRKLLDSRETEIQELLQDPCVQPTFFGMTAPERAMLYLSFNQNTQNVTGDSIKIKNLRQKNENGSYNTIDKNDLNTNATFRDTTDLRWLLSHELRFEIYKYVLLNIYQGILNFKGRIKKQEPDEFIREALRKISKTNWLHYYSCNKQEISDQIFDCVSEHLKGAFPDLNKVLRREEQQ